MSDDRPVGPPAPDSIQKGLLQLLWTTRPWIRNTILVVVGLIAFVVAIVPQGVREDVLRKVFHVGRPDDAGKTERVANPDLGDENSHTSRLKNGHLVRLVGGMVSNRSNVADALLAKAIESDAWRYNQSCYDAEFGSLNTPLPAGVVTVEFDVLDQLPQHAKVGTSDFESSKFASCVVGVLAGQTINEAGSSGSGHVTYAFKFVPT